MYRFEGFARRFIIRTPVRILGEVDRTVNPPISLTNFQSCPVQWVTAAGTTLRVVYIERPVSGVVEAFVLTVGRIGGKSS